MIGRLWSNDAVLFCSTASDRSPPFTDRSLRGRSDSRYFVLRERPFGSIPGDVPAGRMPVPSRAHASSSVRCAGVRPLTPCAPWSGCSSRRGLLAWRSRPRCRPGVRAVQPLENSKASTSIFVLQATKSQRRMPWRLKPKKDVGDCEKPREAVYQASIRGCPNGATQHLS